MSDKLVETFGLTKVYKGCLALDNVSISLEKGKIYGNVYCMEYCFPNHTLWCSDDNELELTKAFYEYSS